LWRRAVRADEEHVALPRDTFVFESTLAYDGGDDARDPARVIRESTLFLRAGGALILELGGDELKSFRGLTHSRFTDVNLNVDDDATSVSRRHIRRVT